MAETIRGLNIKLGLDTSELDNNLKTINSDLKEEQKDLAAINKNLKFDSSNISLWKDKQDKLNSILETTKKKLENQNAKLVEAKKSLEIGAISEEQFNQLKRSIQYTEADISKLNQELAKTKEAINKIGGINVEKLNAIGSSLTKNITVPVIGAVSALSALAIKSLTYADEVADNASKVYLGIEAYQEWGHAFKILAVDEAVMQKTFVKLNGILGDVATGSGDKYSDTLSKIGLTTSDLIGLNSDQAFNLIRNSLSKLEDETLRVAVANEIFGDKIGSELSQVLSATTSDIENLKDEAKALGLISSEDANSAGKFTDSLDNLKLSVKNLGVELGVTLLPVIQKVVSILQEKLIPTISRLINWWKNLSDSTKKIVGIIVALGASLGPVLVGLAKGITIFSKLKEVMSGLKAGTLLKGLSVGKIALAGVIALIVVLLLKNEKFRELLGKIFEALQRLLKPIIELISKLVEKLMPVLNAVISAVEKIISSLVDVLEAVLEPIMDIIDIVILVLEELIGVIVKLLEDILPPVIKIIDMVVGLIVKLIPIITIIINLVGKVLTTVLNLIISILDPIIKILEIIIDIVEVIISVVAELIGSIIKPLTKILEVLGSLIKLVANIILVVVDILVKILTPILNIIIAILTPILELIEVLINVIAEVMGILSPFIDMILSPLCDLLDFIKIIFEELSPLISMVGNIISTILGPALEILFAILEPILSILEKIIEAIKWVLENVGKAFSFVGDLFKGVGNFFGDLFSGQLFSSNSSNKTTTNTTNNVTVNTTSSTFDIGLINKALGGVY